MKPARFRLTPAWAAFAALVMSVSSAQAQSCETSGDLDDATRTAITGSAQRYFDMAAKGDAATLRQNAIPSLASDFSGIESTIKDRQQELTGAQASAKTVLLLDADGTAPLAHAEFYCGVFGKNGQTPGSAELFLDNLPPGKYAVVILDAATPQAHTSFSVILQQTGTEWKIAGLYLTPTQVAGHDSDWFVARARDYKSKGEMHNAWFFYLQARNMASPLPFMHTLATDKLADESQSVRPADLPADGKPADLTAGPTTYKLTAVFPAEVGNDLDLIVKYQAADLSNTKQAYDGNVAAIKALVSKYPEVRGAFAAVVARAVEPSGRDYGTLLAMKDIK